MPTPETTTNAAAGDSAASGIATAPNGLIIGAAMLATVSTVLPGFLVGALSVQIADEFAVSEAIYGVGLASFFLAAALGSALLGRTAQQVGPRRQVTATLLVSAVTALLLAAFANSFLAIVGMLAVLGFSNSGNQSAINLLLTQAQLPRLGLALAIKQSAMPMASLLGGLAVPILAVTVGWRWAYVVAAGIAVVAAIAVRSVIAPVGRIDRAAASTPRTPARVLRFAAVGFACLAFGAGSLNAWTVSSAVDAGVAEGPAGLLLSLGAAAGIGVRLFLGFRLDSMAAPVRVAAALCVVGSLGILALVIRTPWTVVLATVVAFGTGWVWPVLTNFAVVRSNREAAAAATGITQTGVYVGVFLGPLLTGLLIDRAGYGVMWAVTAAVMAIGALTVSRLDL